MALLSYNRIDVLEMKLYKVIDPSYISHGFAREEAIVLCIKERGSREEQIDVYEFRR